MAPNDVVLNPQLAARLEVLNDELASAQSGANALSKCHTDIEHEILACCSSYEHLGVSVTFDHDRVTLPYLRKGKVIGFRLELNHDAAPRLVIISVAFDLVSVGEVGSIRIDIEKNNAIKVQRTLDTHARAQEQVWSRAAFEELLFDWLR